MRDKRPTRTVGVEYEYKWCVDTIDAAKDPHGFLSATVFDRHLGDVSDVVTVVQSTMYLDDERLALADAGHSLGCVVNTGALSSIAWIRLKQTILWTGRRDCLEIAERVPPEDIGRLVDAREVLPIDYARRTGMVSGRLAPVGVATQTRYKRTAVFTDSPAGMAYSVDVVEFRSPDDPATPLSRYSCLEIETNGSEHHALRQLDRLADDITDWLGTSQETATKGQLATWVTHPDHRS
ncbi:hypothetical protein [Actinosynnema sp. ALI-1.44]|uniref:hypothetical protein n=1 Tax=Actinosynnema sp. ALI-1.44 TaxID=1933779 RepID=UPI0011778268|nr:hypothetical protein [Actinosynnema sp. ALI-1.44]